VEKALCYRVVAAGQTEVVDKGHHAIDAAHGRDALAKVIIVLLTIMSISDYQIIVDGCHYMAV